MITLGSSFAIFKAAIYPIPVLAPVMTITWSFKLGLWMFTPPLKYFLRAKISKRKTTTTMMMTIKLYIFKRALLFQKQLYNITGETSRKLELNKNCCKFKSVWQ